MTYVAVGERGDDVAERRQGLVDVLRLVQHGALRPRLTDLQHRRRSVRAVQPGQGTRFLVRGREEGESSWNSGGWDSTCGVGCFFLGRWKPDNHRGDDVEIQTQWRMIREHRELVCLGGGL